MVSREEVLRRIEAMPKVELHVHLEGSADAETVWQLAARNRVRLPAGSLDEWRRFYQFRDFGHFIEVYTAVAGALRTPDDWALLVERFLQQQARQNVRYSEAFLSASHQLGKLPGGEWLHALREGAEAGQRKYASRVRFIPDIARHLPESRYQVLGIVLEGREAGLVVGLGLGGVEVGHPPEGFADVFAEARRQGLRVVAHAGRRPAPRASGGRSTHWGPSASATGSAAWRTPRWWPSCARRRSRWKSARPATTAWG